MRYCIIFAQWREKKNMYIFNMFIKIYSYKKKKIKVS